MRFVTGALGRIVELGLLVFALVWGTSMIRQGNAEKRLQQAPLVPLAELAGHAGTGVPVRVDARAVSLPPLVAPNGELVALQAVRITHEEGSGEDAETVVDYDRLAPQAAWVSDGASAVKVATAGVDLRFVPERYSGSTQARGALPPRAAELVSSSFTELPQVGPNELSVRGINDGAPVSVYGVVAQEGEALVLRAPEDGSLFVISPLPFEEIVSRAGLSGTFNRSLGWLIIAACAAIVGWAVRSRIRARRSASSPALAAA